MPRRRESRRWSDVDGGGCAGVHHAAAASGSNRGGVDCGEMVEGAKARFFLKME